MAGQDGGASRINRNHVLPFQTKGRTESLKTWNRFLIVILKLESGNCSCKIESLKQMNTFLSFIRKLRKDLVNPVNLIFLSS
jgi:hypothetical protein